MPNFKVGYTYEVGGCVTVEADTEQDAHELVWNHLETEGADSLNFVLNDILHREYSITDIEEE